MFWNVMNACIDMCLEQVWCVSGAPKLCVRSDYIVIKFNLVNVDV